MNRAGLLVAFTAALCAAPAHALFGDDEARKAIIELRARVAEQERLLVAKDVELAARLERLEQAQRGQLEVANQLDALRTEIAKLRGQIDQLTNELAQVQKRNKDLYGDLDGRIKQLEPSNLVVDGRPSMVDRAEQSAFDAAMGQFRASDFKGAATALQAFIARYPRSAYAAAAHYWLGNAYYQLKDYRSAMSAQQVVIEKYPESTRAPEALLNIAASQIELNDRRSARTTLQRIIKEYPDTEAAKLAKERLPATATR